jgi:hypothetical protein
LGVCSHGSGCSWKREGFSWELGYVSSTLPIYQVREFLTLDGQTKTVIFHKLQGLQINKTLLYVTSHSINVRRPGFLKINIQAIVPTSRFSNSLPNSYITGMSYSYLTSVSLASSLIYLSLDCLFQEVFPPCFIP